MSHRAVVLLVLPLVLGMAERALATDPPHSFPTAIKGPCTECHKLHAAPGGALTSVAGNANLCQSCHTVGGQASAKALSNSAQAVPGPGLPVGTSASGNSHRWDSGVSGRVAIAAGNASTGRVESGGAFTGRYAKTYTITVSTEGSVGTGRFDWTATSPGGGSGSGVLIAASATPGVSQPILLDEGISVTFSDGASSPSFLLDARWDVYVRTDLSSPASPAMAARLEGGKALCSTCHDQHSQSREPFDPAAPPYAGAGTGDGRHFQRIHNDTDAMCKDCHSSRDVTDAASGSHPVGVAVTPSAGTYQTPLTLPLDKTSGELQCSTCHQLHYGPASDGSLARLSSPLALCTDCHALADTSPSPGAHFFTSDVRTLWPGAQYGTTFPPVTDPGRQGSCANCHQTHGWPDTGAPAQDYPSLLVDGEEKLCNTCHDGSPVSLDVRAEIVKTYRHPAGDYSGRHTAGEGGAAAYGAANRHAECSDCHNPHQAKADASAPVAPAASNRLRRVSGVAVTNGPAGATPSYSPVDSSSFEYELCFKCHSSWTTQPAGQTDLAVALNTNNPSYHPVEGVGRNTNIDINAFVNGWTPASVTYCTDCHSSDNAAVRGPHGSSNAHILKKPYAASGARRIMSSGELCFDCHLYDTYSNRDASPTVQGYSRFNRPLTPKGHAFHVDDKEYPCYSCHDTHGSSLWLGLIVTGRNPGITTFVQTATGGTCNPTCHGQKSYTLNYPR